MEIFGAIKQYDWGSIGNHSKVAQLALKCDNQFVKDFDSNASYAELWMGDHVSGSSIVKSTGQTLAKFLTEDKSSIGGMESLPFLFKVLSITKPLSIQVHPNKAQAEQLHASRPDIYKDPNHKPEISIALTDFLALCGFRTPSDLYRLLKKYKPLTDLIGAENIEELNQNPTEESIRKCYTKLMHSPQQEISECIEKLATVLDNVVDADTESELLRNTFKHCNNYFPNDIGSLSIFFLNILQLKPGDAIFLAANEPHAYLSGDCIECMACSDNVIRAGLTPKFKDVETLLEMLDFRGKNATEKFFQPVDIGPYSKLFQPPVKDFAVVQVTVPAGVQQYAIENRSYGSIIIVLQGKASATANGKQLFDLAEGSIVFVPAYIKSVGLNILQENGADFVAYQALYNDF